MWSLSKPIEMLRYLMVWRVNSSLARTTQDFSAEISRMIGAIIASRLPTSEAAAWRKSLQLWDEYLQTPQEQPSSRKKRRSRHSAAPPVDPLLPTPDASWPVESVILPYAAKRSNGKGAPIIWELKLFGEHAEHDFFLEVILPAIEEAGMSSPLDREMRHSLWGHFDIDAAYVAQGQHWEPFIQGGQLDLNYRPSPYQWAEGLTFDPNEPVKLTTLIWLTPFQWGNLHVQAKQSSDSGGRHKHAGEQALPALHDLIFALIDRMSALYAMQTDEVWELVHPDERVAVQEMLEWLAWHSQPGKQKIHSIPKGWSASWVGMQTFPEIPPQLIPYLELASILHIGKYTHFGHGTFTLR